MIGYRGLGLQQMLRLGIDGVKRNKIITPAFSVIDTFTDTDGVLLQNHTPDLAPASWTIAAGTWDILNNKITHGSTPNHSVALIDSGVADCTVSAIVRMATAADDVGLFLRSDGTANNGIFVRIYANNNVVDLYKVVSTVFTSVDQAAFVSTYGIDYLLEVVMNGSNITVSVDSVEKCSGTITEGQTNTKHGLRSYSNRADISWDDFKVTA